MIHQGAELYGSDKIFLLVVDHLSKTHSVDVILDSEGPLCERLNNTSINSLKCHDLAVLRRVKLSGFTNLLKTTFNVLRQSMYLRRKIKNGKYDIVYINTLAVITPLIACMGLSNIKVIHHLHEIQDHPKSLFRILYTLSSVLADRVICVSQSVKTCFESMSLTNTANKSSVIYNGLPSQQPLKSDELDRFKMELSKNLSISDSFLIAYVARLHSWKGQVLFLDVIDALVNVHHKDVKVAFFGSAFPGYEMIFDELKAKSVSLGIDKNVYFFGFREDARQLFLVSDISIMGSTSPDPLPTVVLESFQNSTPVIAYDHGGSSEMIQHGVNGALVTPLDTSKMTEEILYLIDNPSKVQELGEAAFLRYQEAFSLPAFLLNIEKEILGLS